MSARFTPLDALPARIRAGAGIMVFVEGEEQQSDAWVLGHLLERWRTEVAFMGRDGREQVIRDLGHTIPNVPNNQLFAIVDRDFADEADVEACYQSGFNGYLYTLRRSCIENYLLEPAWISDPLETFYLDRPQDLPTSLQGADAIRDCLLSWGRGLATQVAGNWVIADLRREADRRGLQVNARAYFDDIAERSSDYVMDRLKQYYVGQRDQAPDLLDEHEIERCYEKRLTEVLSSVETLDRLHQIVSGKLLFRACSVAKTKCYIK